ncbi:hypothetical protein [Methylocystis heyeri]|uniref:DUF4376 domain-containing protein n=1 Tax=Methylocystis heyeri TaxID=391905 RepID=A0A6B8KJJ3_9HYPH|nr:hypothetical protein [Methylocystis heyeri]QGM46743.1 hypothetical protein H2LOC_014150 [Methylocystis heyeri]
MTRTALIKGAKGPVEHVVLAGKDWVFPEGYTAVASETANVGDVYDGAGFTAPPSPAPTATELAAYARSKQAAIAGGMILVHIGAQSVEVSLDPQSLAALNGAAALASGNPGAVFTWVGSVGGTQLTSAQILTIYGVAHAFVQNSFTTLGAVLAAIAAGAITTFAQVDNPPTPLPSWPQS